MKLVTMILTAILAASVLLFGCKLHQQEPVAQQKSIPRLLDELSPLSKNVKKVVDNANEVSNLMTSTKRVALGDREIEKLTDAIITSGSKGIAEFKNARLRLPHEAFVDNNREIMKRIDAKIDNMSESTRLAYDKILGGGENISGARQGRMADFLKENTDIASDKIFVRLVKAQDVILDDIAEAIAVNHVIAEEVGANIAKRLSINSEDTVAALKVGHEDFNFLPKDGKTFNNPNTASNHFFLEGVSGVNLFDEVLAIEQMLSTRKMASRIRAYSRVAEDLENPFDRGFVYPLSIKPPKGTDLLYRNLKLWRVTK